VVDSLVVRAPGVTETARLVDVDKLSLGDLSAAQVALLPLVRIRDMPDLLDLRYGKVGHHYSLG
jgi:hypothetical protein